MINDLMSADPRAEGGDIRNIYKVGLNTSRLLMALGDVVCAWLLLRGAEVALEKLGGEVIGQGQVVLRGQGRGRAVLRAHRAAEAHRRAGDRRGDRPVADGARRERLLRVFALRVRLTCRMPGYPLGTGNFPLPRRGRRHPSSHSRREHGHRTRHRASRHRTDPGPRTSSTSTSASWTTLQPARAGPGRQAPGRRGRRRLPDARPGRLRPLPRVGPAAASRTCTATRAR